jgi:hypothetical protein
VKNTLWDGCAREGQTGTNSATAVSVQMKSAFPSIRFGLMVGISGGVPSEEADIQLGDVVVGRPHNEHGGVVQYDSKEATPTGFKRIGFLNAPPTILLNAITNLRANYIIGRCRLMEYFSTLNYLPKFAREDTGQDILFEAEYNREGGATYGKCSKDKLVARDRRRQEVVVY